MKLYELLLKIQSFIDEHKTAFDLSVGGSMGFFTTVVKYWEHFTQEENLFHFYDSIWNTAINTLVGAFLFWALHKFVFKTKKEDK